MNQHPTMILHYGAGKKTLTMKGHPAVYDLTDMPRQAIGEVSANIVAMLFGKTAVFDLVREERRAA